MRPCPKCGADLTQARILFGREALEVHKHIHLQWRIHYLLEAIEKEEPSNRLKERVQDYRHTLEILSDWMEAEESTFPGLHQI